MRRIPVPSWEEGSRLDRFLRRQFPTASRHLLQRLVRTGGIKVEGYKKLDSSTHLKPEEIVLVPESLGISEAGDGNKGSAAPKTTKTTDGKGQREVPDWVRKSILYEDEHFFVINKPAGISCQPDKSNQTSVSTDFKQMRGSAAESPRLIHRLDKGCSGALVIARTLQAAQHFSELLKHKSRIKKTYWALTAGKPLKSEGRIKTAYDGKAEITEYRTLDQSSLASWLELIPVTGRKRQLRRHCAKVLACPIIGDALQANEDTSRTLQLLGVKKGRDLQLHSWEVEFYSIGDKHIQVRAPAPPSFTNMLSRLNFHHYREDTRQDQIAAEAKRRQRKTYRKQKRIISRATNSKLI